MPIQRPIAEIWFYNINRKEFKGINVGTLQMVAEKMNLNLIDVETLISGGISPQE